MIGYSGAIIEATHELAPVYFAMLALFFVSALGILSQTELGRRLRRTTGSAQRRRPRAANRPSLART